MAKLFLLSRISISRGHIQVVHRLVREARHGRDRCSQLNEDDNEDDLLDDVDTREQDPIPQMKRVIEFIIARPLPSPHIDIKCAVPRILRVDIDADTRILT